MEQCDYCGAEFESEDAYLAHLAGEHEGELSAIDRRRAASVSDDDGEFPTGPVVIVLVVAFSLALVVYVTMFLGGSQQPVHQHGLIEITIEGERIDLSRSEYQLQADRFHLEAGNGRMWHTHASGVTLGDALATLGVQVDGSTLTFQGTTYRDGDQGTNVSVTVNGESVDPDSYVLQGVQDESRAEQGDHVRVVVETDGN